MRVPPSKRRLDISIVGSPNAGKSQLLNALSDDTIAAVSRKRHTTRNRINGIYNHNPTNTQLVFVDTPGYVTTKIARDEGIYRTMLQCISTEMTAAEYSLLVIDAAKRLTDKERILLVQLMTRAERAINFFDRKKDIKKSGKWAIVLNKVDLVKPKENLINIASDVGKMADSCVRYCHLNQESKIMPTLDMLVDYYRYDNYPEIEPYYPPVFYLSARKKDKGVDELRNFLLQHARIQQNNTLCMELTPQQRVEEIIREKLYRYLHKEIPHQIRQKNRLFQKITDNNNQDKLEKKILLIHQDLYVQSNSQVKIVRGKRQLTIQKIQRLVEKDLKYKVFREEKYDNIVLLMSVKLDSKKKHTP